LSLRATRGASACAARAKQSRNILTIHKIAASLKLLAMTRITVLQSSHTLLNLPYSLAGKIYDYIEWLIEEKQIKFFT
ncbi:MAG: hypothetical protein Q7J27_15095, partial [Syntrophales bacterium]|nr:hypothetical protein [Syntrophales bacterium]